MKKFLSVFCVLCIAAVLLCLSGCTPSVKNESEMGEDLYASAAFQYYRENAGFQIDSVEIIKRQTSPEEKVDSVWVTANVSGKDAEGTMSFLLTYELYNDGWLFESAEENDIDTWKAAPIQGLDESELQNYLPADATITSIATDIDIGQQQVQYSYVENYPLCEIVRQREMDFYFGTTYYNGFGIWQCSGATDIGASENWNIDGVWQYEKSDGYGTWIATMEIQDFDPQGIAYNSDSANGTFTISGCFNEFSSDSRVSDLNYAIEDSGPFTVTCRNAPWIWTVEEDTNCYIIETSARRGPSYSTREVKVYKDKVVFVTGGGDAKMEKVY